MESPTSPLDVFGAEGLVSGSGGERLSLVLVVVHAERDRLTRRVQRPVHGNGENVLDDVLDDLLAANGALVREIHRTILRRHHQLLLLLLKQCAGYFAPDGLPQGLQRRGVARGGQVALLERFWGGGRRVGRARCILTGGQV